MLLLSCVLLPEPRSARARGRTSRQCSQTLETPTVSGAIPGSPDSRGRRDAEIGGVMLRGARGAAHTCCGIFRPALWSRPASAGPSTTDDTRRRRRRAAAGPSRGWDRSRHTHTPSLFRHRWEVQQPSCLPPVTLFVRAMFPYGLPCGRPVTGRSADALMASAVQAPEACDALAPSGGLRGSRCLPPSTAARCARLQCP